MNKPHPKMHPAPAGRRGRKFFLRPWLAVGTLSILGVVTGCALFWNTFFAAPRPEVSGTVPLAGLQAPALVRRDNLGIPFIEAASPADLAFATGYVHAADRLTQMVNFKLAAQGRLAEMAGPAMLEMDVYMRALKVHHVGRTLYDASSDRLKALLGDYSRGVNAYLETHKDALPFGLKITGYQPEPWTPEDSASVFALLMFGLSTNLTEEINSLNLLTRVSPGELAWLFPIYPDEPLPFDEAAKLAGLEEMTAGLPRKGHLPEMASFLDRLGLGTVPASNNWAVAGSRTRGGKSILANDTHLPLSMPSIWNMAHLRSPDYEAAGVTLAGLPGVVAGYNGHIAWGMTMVMADTQDVFLEKLKTIGGQLHYLYEGEWVPALRRTEVFRVKGEDPVRRVFYETRHGPLINDLVKEPPEMEFVNRPPSSPYGMAVSWAALEPDQTLDAFFSLPSARSVPEAGEIIRGIRAIALNMVYADADTIAWQVTGRYPLRRKGRGLFPSPGWTGEYGWTGFLDPARHPAAVNPAEGFIGTANHRTVPPDFPFVLSSSWYYPSRSERIRDLLENARDYRLEDARQMQYDVYSSFVPKLQKVLLEGELARDLKAEIASWEAAGRRQSAEKALRLLAAHSGRLTVDSTAASMVGAFFATSVRRTFLDELGPEDGAAWAAFLKNADVAYSAPVDHLIVRGDESPFWDDVTTPATETKAQVLARSLADAAALLKDRYGADESAWEWGRIHTYTWQTESFKLSRKMGWFAHTAMEALSGYLNRGPFPAPGDHTTLNVAGYHIGRGFDVWLIPAMRLIVDFNLDEPLRLVNSSGQSGNPASPHYDDGIFAWLEGAYQPFPFGRAAIEAQYREVLLLAPPLMSRSFPETPPPPG